MEFNLKYTSNFLKHYNTKKKILISQGSGRSGKTFAILELLIIIGFSEPNKTISVVGENMPFIKRGVLADFKHIMIKSGLWNLGKFNKTNNIFEFPTGTIIQFFSVENPTLALGATRDYLFINECNNIEYETAFQLIARTKGRIFLDFNPVSEFWVHLDIMNNLEFDGMWDFIKTTFAGNELLDESIKEVMLARAAKDPNYKRVYVDGEVGFTEGVIFSNWCTEEFNVSDIIERYNIKKQYFGVDFGWSNDPTSINEILIVEANEDVKIPRIYINQLHYHNKTTNKQIAEIIKANKKLNNYEVIADSSEPKSIDEIFTYGINIKGALKPSGSILYGIGLLQEYDIIVNVSSLDTIKEFRNYKWGVDRLGQPLHNSKGQPIPVDNWNHSIDNIRYIIYNKTIGERETPKYVHRDYNSGLRAV